MFKGKPGMLKMGMNKKIGVYVNIPGAPIEEKKTLNNPLLPKDTVRLQK